ncbi:hypothetical protein A2696_01025 [Candidatus Curtissbacteria bacterium RIFCSPHIGHO2_01_FULL_41_13]|uniref:DDH domain-containing protein n=1 Tax=Candidatus Curtissbacteria bacterium RIFCSPHIGHO2_01_FULL_41_13 TaxID=1797745 RepID=A0A1F5G1R8_9BACT|nr:MAG: hypothetical protein A2696_01025 [Candidatus Curtissbacteria bacterium RIFCSPHIGHO2_01_FULL_41_13]
MDNYIKNQTLEHLTKAQNITIAVSQNSGFDGLAAGLALYLSTKKLGKNASILANPPTVEDAKMLYGVDKIGKPEGKQNLVVVVDNAVKNVEKVTYFLDEDRLRIVIHSFPGSKGTAKEDISYEETASKPDLIFVIGFNSINELRNEVTHEQIINPDTWTISINKNEMSQKFAQANVHEHQAASISEITATLIQNLALPVDEDIAFNLYSGISHATEMFSPSYSRPSSFEAALWLVKFGAGKASLAARATQQPSFASLEGQTYHAGSSITKVTSPPSEELTKKPAPPDMIDRQETQIEEVEVKEKSQEAWLKPPKIYRGSKSFDSES